MVNVYTVAHLNQAIVDNLHHIRALDADLIVHLPRSGTLPASLIATYLCKPLQSVQELCAGLPVIDRKSDYSETKTILLVDDSINRGVQMPAAIEQINAKRAGLTIKTLAVYDNKDSRRSFNCDLTLFKHGAGYVMPWFLWKSKLAEQMAFDMDGVLCRDCVKGEDNDGENYLNFLQTAELKFKPLAHTLGAIITARMEKYRPQTEDWLARHSIKYHKLVMLPVSSLAERKAMDIGHWKARQFVKTGLDVFVESSVKQALVISQKSGKTVFCVDNQEVYK